MIRSAVIMNKPGDIRRWDRCESQRSETRCTPYMIDGIDVVIDERQNLGVYMIYEHNLVQVTYHGMFVLIIGIGESSNNDLLLMVQKSQTTTWEIKALYILV